MEWRISIETEPVADEDDPAADEPLTDEARRDALVDAVLERLEADAAALRSVVFGREGTLGAIFIVDTESAGDAARAAVDAFERALSAARASALVVRLELEPAPRD